METTNRELTLFVFVFVVAPSCRSVSGKKLCSSCGQPLGKGAAMIIETLSLYFHIHCFKVGVEFVSFIFLLYCFLTSYSAIFELFQQFLHQNAQLLVNILMNGFIFNIKRLQNDYKPLVHLTFFCSCCLSSFFPKFSSISC